MKLLFLHEFFLDIVLIINYSAIWMNECAGAGPKDLSRSGRILEGALHVGAHSVSNRWIYYEKEEVLCQKSE